MDRQQRRLLERKQARSPQRSISMGQAASKPVAPSSAALGAIIQEALGLAQQRLGDGQLDEARQLYEGVLEIKPNQPDALLGLAGMAVRIGQPEAARTVLARGIVAHPQLGRLHSEHATVLRQLNRLDEAIAGYRRAAALMPQEPTAWNNLGTVLYEDLQFEESRQAYRRAVILAPEYARGHHGLGLVSLMLGDLTVGLAEHEWRWRVPGYTSEGEGFFRTFWDGGDLHGRTILLHDEQGFGDTLHYVRYVPLVKARGGTVILRCQPALGRLLEHSVGADRVLSIPRGEPMPPFDVHAPLMSLPHLLGTTLETIPATVPYVQPLPDDMARWSARLAPDAGFKVGLVWAGSPLHANDSRRSLSLDTLSTLAQPGVSIYSLQKDAASAALAGAPDGLRPVDLGPDLHDFAETAAAISQLDLVITVDTAVGHLTGALGRPVWVLLSAVHDTRWMTERTDSPWYPTVRLFRQQPGEGWAPVLARVRDALHELAAQTT